MGIGIVIMILVLAIGLPTINRIRDKNTATETQELMLILDKNIREVYSEGPGSQRPLKLDVKRGTLEVDASKELVIWNFETTVLLTEPNLLIKRGSLQILTTPTTQVRKYRTTFRLNYTDVVDLELSNPNSQFAGSNNIIITNIGIKQSNKVPTVLITTI